MWEQVPEVNIKKSRIYEEIDPWLYDIQIESELCPLCHNIEPLL